MKKFDINVETITEYLIEGLYYCFAIPMIIICTVALSPFILVGWIGTKITKKRWTCSGG